MALAPFATRFGAQAMVCTVDQLAAQAGLGALREGGSAADGAVAAAAVLAVTHQHQCGIGGDLMAVVHRDGEARPYALNASGRAGSGADPNRLRAAGSRSMPAVGDPGCVPVPGCVDGWLALHDRFGRLPLERLLDPAIAQASEGFAASAGLARASAGLAGVAGAQDFTRDGGLRPGSIVRRPGVATVLRALAEQGRAGVYGGEFGQELLELGAGEYTPDDLGRLQAEWVAPLGVDALGGQLWSLPPNSQGYLLLTSAAALESVNLPDLDDPGWPYLLIEASRAAAFDRSRWAGG